MLNKNIQKTSFFRYLVVLMLMGGFGLWAYVMLFPTAPSNAASTATAEIDVNVDPTLEMALSSTMISLEANGESSVLPGVDGVLATGNINVYVTSNGSNSYNLYVYTPNSTNEMKHVNTNVNASIGATAGGVSTLADDTWGYKYGNASNWTAVATDSNNPAAVTTGTKTSSICNNIETNYASCPTGSVNVHTVTFGAKVTDSLPSGRYTSDVVFSVVAEGNAGN